MTEQALQYLALSTGQRIVDLEMSLAKALAERDEARAEVASLATSPENPTE